MSQFFKLLTRGIAALVLGFALVAAAPVVDVVAPGFDTPALAGGGDGEPKHGGPWQDDNESGVVNFLDGSHQELANDWGHSVALQWLWHLLNLIILVGGLAFFAHKGIRAVLRDRATGIQKELDESAEVKAEAEQRYQELEQRLSGFETEVARMREDAAKAIEAEKAAALKRAEETAARIRAAAEQTIRDEHHKATKALRSEAVQLAVELAERTLTAEVSDADRKRLATDFLQTLKSEGASGATHG